MWFIYHTYSMCIYMCRVYEGVGDSCIIGPAGLCTLHYMPGSRLYIGIYSVNVYKYVDHIHPRYVYSAIIYILFVPFCRIILHTLLTTDKFLLLILRFSLVYKANKNNIRKHEKNSSHSATILCRYASTKSVNSLNT